MSITSTSSDMLCIKDHPSGWYVQIERCNISFSKLFKKSQLDFAKAYRDEILDLVGPKIPFKFEGGDKDLHPGVTVQERIRNNGRTEYYVQTSIKDELGNPISIKKYISAYNGAVIDEVIEERIRWENEVLSTLSGIFAKQLLERNIGKLKGSRNE